MTVWVKCSIASDIVEVGVASVDAAGGRARDYASHALLLGPIEDRGLTRGPDQHFKLRLASPGRIAVASQLDG